MKKFIFILIIFSCNAFAQQTALFYYMPCTQYVVAPPIYTIQREIGLKKAQDFVKGCVLEVKDSLFLRFVDKKIVEISYDTCFECSIQNLNMEVMQIVFIKNNYQYFVINMSHSVLGQQIETEPRCFIEINGTSYHCDSEFQVVMDEVLNYRIIEKIDPTTKIIHNILKGVRYHPHPYICIDPIPDL